MIPPVDRGFCFHTKEILMSKHRPGLVRRGLLAISVLAAVLAHPALSAALSSTPQACGNDWSVVPSPNKGTMDNDLYGAATVSDTDAWAVGTYRDASFRDLTLALHWDGSAWTVIPTPNVGTHTDFLYDVDASSSTDAWAVGLDNPGAPYKTLIEHWNGSTWSVVPSPSQTSDAILYGVEALSATDAWAVGYQVNTIGQTLVEHWNGVAWSEVSSPNVGSDSNVLNAVHAVSPTDIWAVGSYYTTSQRPLTLHWDGSQWTAVTSPDPGVQTILNAVAATSVTDAWAVGLSNGQPYTQHWDGAGWATVAASPISSGALRGVAASPSIGVQAIGQEVNDTYALGWTGAKWVAEPIPNPGASLNLLKAVDATGGQVWTVGGYSDGSKLQTLIEESCLTPVSIEGFGPPSGQVGTGVTITGTGFEGVSEVTFNGGSAGFRVDSPTQIRAKVPMGATTGPIAVATSHGSATSLSDFTVRPKIAGFRPTIGPVGTVVTIGGSAFDGATSVTFNGTAASFTVQSYSRINATVPLGATTGPIVVVTPSGQTRSATDFIVT